MIEYSNVPPAKSKKPSLSMRVRTFFKKRSDFDETEHSLKKLTPYNDVLEFFESGSDSDINAMVEYIRVLGLVAEESEISEIGRAYFDSLVRSTEDRSLVAAFIDGNVSRLTSSASMEGADERKDLYLISLNWAKQRILGELFSVSNPEGATQMINSVKREQVFSQTYRMVVKGARE